MKNITIKENGQGVTIHTPHGQVVVRVHGGDGFNMNETKVTVIGSLDGRHFMQAGEYNAPPIVFPERMFGNGSHIYPIRLRHRGAIQIKEMGNPKSPTPLGVLAIDSAVEKVLVDSKEKT